MAELIVAVFDTERAAVAAEHDLVAGGVPRTAIRRYQRSGPVAGATQTPARPAAEPASGGFWAWLFGDEAPAHEHEALYQQHIDAGQEIVSVSVAQDRDGALVMQILERHAPADVTTEATGSGGAGRGRTAPEAVPPAGITTAETAARTDPNQGSRVEGEAVIPLRDEKLDVGKRQVGGTTRIRRYVVEQPVSETVGLRDETTTIERRRPAAGTTAAGQPIEERTVEVQETREVPVVSKTAQVKEEVVVGKTATERSETVHDKVRREEIAIEPAEKPSSATDKTNQRVTEDK